MGKISFSYFELRFFKVTYSRLQKKLIPSLTRTKINFLWISFIHLLSFYLDNLNLPLTRSNFCFLSDHFYIILPSIIRNVLRSVLKFISTQPCILCLYFFFNPLQIQCPALIMNIPQALLLQFLCQSINLSLAVLEVKCAWYLHSFSPSCLFPYFRLSALNSR